MLIFGMSGTIGPSRRVNLWGQLVKPSKPKSLAIQITFYLFFIVIFFTGSIKYLAGSLLVVTIVAAVIASPVSIQVLREKLIFTKAYFYFCSAFLVIVVLNILFGRADWEGYGLLITFPVSFLIAMAISQHTKTTDLDLYKLLVAVSSAHSAFLIIVSFTQVYIFNISRPHGDISTIGFAHMMTISGGITAIWLYQKARTAPTIGHLLLLLGWLLVLIYSVHMTGTRGAIIVFIPFLLGLILINLKDSGSVVMRLIPVLLLALTVLMTLIVGSDRFEEGLSELSQNIDNQVYVGSAGYRLGMWAEAWKLILERPITGHGLLQFHDITSLPDTVPYKRFNHVHNQFLDVWMKAGIGGLIFIIALLGLPVIVGIKLFIDDISPNAGLTLIFLGGSYFTFGLTEVYLEKPDATTLLATYVPMLLVFSDRKMNAASR